MSELAIPYFDGREITCDSTLPRDVTEPGEKAAWDAFLALGPQDRLADSRHLYAYYSDFRDAVGGEDWMDKEMGIPKTPHDIWPHVRPSVVWASQDPDSGIWFIELEANCDWEEEHGVQMVWEHGAVLTKAGGFDGHTQNYFPKPTPETDKIVYNATNPKFVTTRD